MRFALHAIVAVLTLSPIASAVLAPAGPTTLADAALDAIREHLGGRAPGTVTFDAGLGAREVPLADALAMLDAWPAPRRGDVPPVPAIDVGYGVRMGPYPCYVAAVATAFHLTFDGVPGEGFLFAEPVVAAPEPPIACGPGFVTWVGDAGAELAPGASGIACVAYDSAFGAWANEPQSCHVEDYRTAAVSGRVGRMRAGFCEGSFCFTLAQVFGGTVNAPAETDAAVIRLG